MYEMTFDGATAIEATKAATTWLVNNEAEASLIYTGALLEHDSGWTVMLYFDKSGGK